MEDEEVNLRKGLRESEEICNDLEELRNDLEGLRKCSEGITYGQVEGEGFLEGYIEVMARAVAVGSMKAVAKIAAQDKHSYVYPQADSGPQSDILEEGFGLKQTARSQRVILQ